MARGAERGKVAAIGWGAVTVTQVYQNGLEYADLAALDAAAPETDTMGAASTWSVQSAVVYGGTYAPQLTVIGDPGAASDAYRTTAIAGLTPNRLHRVRLAVWLDRETGGSSGIAFGLEVVGGTSKYIELDGTIGYWILLEAEGTSDGAGNLSVRWGAFGAISPNVYNRTSRFDDLRAFEVAGAVSSQLLRFRLDGALSWPQEDPGSSRAWSVGGGRVVTWSEGQQHYLRGTARWIPDASGVQWSGDDVTGWDAADGWGAFLVAARDHRPLTFYPDAANLAVGYPCYWHAPMEGPPELDGVRFRRLEFTLRSPSAAFPGY